MLWMNLVKQLVQLRINLFSIAKIADAVRGEIEGDSELIIKGVCGLQDSQTGYISYLLPGKYENYFDTTKASAFLINKSLIIDRKDDVMVISEALLQFDRRTQAAYVEVETGNQKFERKDIQIGLSDGINVEVLSGLNLDSKIKIWNKTEPIKIEAEESAFDEFRDD